MKKKTAIARILGSNVRCWVEGGTVFKVSAFDVVQVWFKKVLREDRQVALSWEGVELTEASDLGVRLACLVEIVTELPAPRDYQGEENMKKLLAFLPAEVMFTVLEGQSIEWLVDRN